MAVTSALLKRSVYGPFNVHHALLTGDGSYPNGGYVAGNGTVAGGGYNVFGYPAVGYHLRGGVCADGRLESYSLFETWCLYTAVGTAVTTGASATAATAPAMFWRAGGPSAAGSAVPFGNLRIGVRVFVGPASYDQTTGVPITPATYGMRSISAVFVPAYAEGGDYLCRWDKAGSCLRVYTAVGTEVTNGTNLSTAVIAHIAFGR